MSENLVEGLQAPALIGSITAEVALDQLLINSDLTYIFANENTVVVRAVEPSGQDDTQRVKEKSFDNLVLEEITVSVTRRAMTLQDTAMSITAINNEDVKRKALQGF